MPNENIPARLRDEFLEMAQQKFPGGPPKKVLKTNTFNINGSNVLIRTASVANPRYFFGLNYINAEEICALSSAFVVFVCGDSENLIFLPVEILAEVLAEMSQDRNGEYKINITKDFNLVRKGKKNDLDCNQFRNRWDLLSTNDSPSEGMEKAITGYHSILQGRLLELGRFRGMETYSPDKSRIFKGKRLGDLSTLDACPRLQFTDHDLLRKIDVIWFKRTNGDFYPVAAFEVELTTGQWSGFGRLSTLSHLPGPRLYIVSSESRLFNRAKNSFPHIQDRTKLLLPPKIDSLYSAELKLLNLRKETI